MAKTSTAKIVALEPSAEFILPAGGIQSSIRMLTAPSGTDQTVAALIQQGWSGFEHPLPTKFFDWARRRPGVVADVGANSGLYSLLGTFAAPGNEVFAFEADPEVFKVLERNLDLNFGHRVTALAMAVSDTSGEADLFIPAKGHGLVETSSSLEQSFKPEHSSVIKVKVTSIDAVVKERLRRDQRLSVAKVDIEGHEWPALSGAGWSVHRFRPLLFVEVLDRAAYDFLTHFLSEHSYLDVPLLPEGRLAAYGNVEFHPGAWNHAFVPSEMLPEFLAG